MARHDYTSNLAKAGLQMEISLLKEEIRDLQAAACVASTQYLSSTPAYTDRIRCLTKKVDDYKAQLKAVVHTNQELANKLNEILPPGSATPPIHLCRRYQP